MAKRKTVRKTAVVKAKRRNPPDKTERNLIPIRRNAKMLEHRITWVEERNLKFGLRIQQLEEDLREVQEQLKGATNAKTAESPADPEAHQVEDDHGGHPEDDGHEVVGSRD